MTDGRFCPRVFLLLILAQPLLAAAAGVQAVLVWPEPLVIGTTLTGVVESVVVKPGDRVAAGDVLLRMDSRDARARLQAAEARLQEVRAAYDEAKRENERATELYDRTVLSDHDLQLARIRFNNANAVFQQANADLVHARLQLEYVVVRAPADGFVLKLPAYAGQAVVNLASMQALVYLQPAGRMEARANVAAGELNGIYPGGGVVIKVGGRRLAGTVTGMQTLVSGADVRFLLSAVVDTAGIEGLTAGQSLLLELP